MSRVPAVVLQTILKHGNLSTSFLGTYPGFLHFLWEGEAGTTVITYLQTPTAWVAASEPNGPGESVMEAFFAFAKAAKKDGRIALMLPTSQKFAHAVRAQGFKAFQIGEEPWYLTETFTSPKLAKQATARGAVVEKFDPATLSGREKIELEAVTQAWLDSRRSAPLEFLNQVKPWVNLTHKKYFRVKINGRQIAYLSAIPVAAKNAWYFIDLIRTPSSPLGTAELLISRAAQELGNEGSKEFTLGMSPLVPVTSNERKKHPLFYSLLGFTFEHLNAAYNFKSLYQFKSKLKPDLWEPLFLVSSDSGSGLKTLSGLANVVYPEGFFKSTWVTSLKMLKLLIFKPKFTHILSDYIVPRSFPANAFELMTRIRVSVGFTLVNILVFFLSTTPEFTLRETAKTRFEFSISRFINNGVSTDDARSLFLHSFIHWNLSHLLFNLFLLMTLVAFLEIIAGSSIVFLSYLVGILVSNPLTSLIFIAPLTLLDTRLANFFVHEVDVGASLGIFACLGVLAHFVKRPKIFIALFSLGTMVVAVATSSLLALDHLIAVALGYGIGKFYVQTHEK